MTALSPRQQPHSSAVVPGGFSRLEGKRHLAARNCEISRGLVAGTTVQAAGFVAAAGLQMVGMLSREAAFQTASDRAAAGRAEYIIDRYTELVGDELVRFDSVGGR